MGLHRLTAPAYFGGLPVGYDYINNLLSGTPANVDGAKVGGPNAGTYFVAFGEDATCGNTNRPAKALAQNTDYLDDLLHRDIALSTTTNLVTSDGTGAHGSVTTGAGTFVGVVGTPNTAAGINTFVEVVDQNFDEIVNSSGDKVYVASISGATVGTGFSAGSVTFTFSQNIPNGVQYRLIYGARGNLATLPQDAFTNVTIRGAQEVDQQVESLFFQLHGGSQAWNATWQSSIYDLTRGGLNERYSASRAFPFSLAPEPYFTNNTNDFDTSGAGAYIIRGGPAVSVYAQDVGAYKDPLNALVVGKFFDSTPADSGGAVGFALFGSYQSGTAWTGETLNHTPGAASFYHLWPHYFQTSLHASNPYTRIVDGATASFGMVGGYDVNTGEAIVQVTAANNYFRQPGGSSAISLGYDLIEISYTVSSVFHRKILVIVAHGSTADPTSQVKVRVRNLDGTVPDFSTPFTGTIKWISSTFLIGDGAAAYHSQLYSDVSPVKHNGFFFQVPPSLSSNAGDDNVPRNPPSFSARDNTNATLALRWGGFDATASGPAWGGFLRGDGSFRATGASAVEAQLTVSGTGGLSVTSNSGATISGTSGLTVSGGDVSVTGSGHDISVAAGDITAAGTSNTTGAVKGNYVVTNTQLFTGLDIGQTVTMDMSLGSFVGLQGQTANQVLTLDFSNIRVGGTYVVIFNHSTVLNSSANVSLVWGGAGITHRHSPGGDDQPQEHGGREKWVGHAPDNSTILWTVTRYP